MSVALWAAGYLVELTSLFASARTHRILGKSDASSRFAFY